MLGSFGRLEGNLGEMIDLGAVPGAKPWSKFGYGTVGTTFSTVYSAGVSPGLYEYMAVPGTIKIASTDPDDTFLGSGANLIYIEGLCDKGCIHSEILQLSGQTPVESETIFSRVYRMVNISKTGHDVQGQLYAGPSDAIFTAGEPDHILAHINDGFNQTQMALGTVPSGYTLFVYGVGLTAPRDKEVDVGVFMRQADITDLSNCSVFALKVNWLLGGAPVIISLAGTPFVMPELTDFEFRAKIDVGTANVATNATGYLIPNKYIQAAT